MFFPQYINYALIDTWVEVTGRTPQLLPMIHTFAEPFLLNVEGTEEYDRILVVLYGADDF